MNIFIVFWRRLFDKDVLGDVGDQDDNKYLDDGDQDGEPVLIADSSTDVEVQLQAEIITVPGQTLPDASQ